MDEYVGECELNWSRLTKVLSTQDLHKLSQNTAERERPMQQVSIKQRMDNA